MIPLIDELKSKIPGGLPIDTLSLSNHLRLKLKQEQHVNTIEELFRYITSAFDENTLISRTLNIKNSIFTKSEWNELCSFWDSHKTQTFSRKVSYFSGQPLSNSTEGGSSRSILELISSHSDGIQSGIPKLDAMFFKQCIPTEAVIEICGPPGAGKSQLAMQLAVNTAFGCFSSSKQPKKVIYIETEHSLMNLRFHQMAENMLDHPVLGKNCCKKPFQELLDNIEIYQPFEDLQLVALIHQLSKLVSNDVGLIVLDSVSFPFRACWMHSEMTQRTTVLSQLIQQLHALASKFHLTVIVTNQIAYKMVNKIPQMTPSLGSVWKHSVSHRLMLSYDKKQFSIEEGQTKRLATLSLTSGPGLDQEVYYQVLDEGVRALNPIL